MKVIKDDGNLEEFNINKIINAVNKLDNIYFENTASFLESRYTQY